jgi:hypothetical protein
MKLLARSKFRKKNSNLGLQDLILNVIRLIKIRNKIRNIKLS